MKITKIAEVADMENQQCIPAIQGKIKELWQRKSGGNGDKAWTVQSGTLTNGGDEIKFSAWNHDDLGKLKGKLITMLSFQGDRGWTGVFAHDNEYKGNVTRELKLTKAAEIVEAGSAARPAANDDADNDGRDNEDGAPEEQPEATPIGGSGKSNVLPVKAFLWRRASGLKICLKIVYDVREEFEAATGGKMTDEQFQAMVSTMFIAGDKAGQFDELPCDLDFITLEKRVKKPEPVKETPKPKTAPKKGFTKKEPVEGDDVPC